MTLSEILGFIFLAMLLLAYLVFFLFSLCNSYSVELLDGKTLVIANCFKSYKIKDYDGNGVYIVDKQKVRYINAKRISHFWVIDIVNVRLWFNGEKQNNPEREKGE